MQTLQIMHMDEPSMVSRRDVFLLELRGLALNPLEIGWKDGVDREAMQHLESIVAWVRRWQATGGDRDRMVRQGFAYPPVAPGVSPEHDWRCFERWMRHARLHWNHERWRGRVAMKLTKGMTTGNRTASVMAALTMVVAVRAQ